MRKIISFLLSFAILLALAMPAMAATVKQEIKDGITEVSAGEQVQIDVTLDEALTGIATFEYRLYYNPDLFEMVSQTGTVDVTDNKSNPAKPYIAITKCWDGATAFDIAAGVIASVTFQAKADISDAASAGFELLIEAVDDPDFNSLVDEFTTENSNLTITVKPDAPAQTYTVTLPENPVGYTITPAEGSESPVAEGGSFSFTVTVKEGYEGDPVVKANGLNLVLKDGVYTISNITANQTVTVDGIKEEGLPADKVVYQNGSNGARWPNENVPVYVNTLTLKGLAVVDVTWDAAYENCTVTLHKKTAADAAYSLALEAAVAGNPQMISMFSATINGSSYTGGTFAYSGSLENGRAQIEVTAKASNYSGTKTINLVVEGASEPEAKTYEVTLTEGEGYTITAAEGSVNPVAEGGSFSFLVTVNDGYQGTALVKANGSELSAVNGVYTIENITADQVVTVSGITQRAPGYTVEVPASTTTVVNGEVTVEVKTGHSSAAVDYYNAYDVILSYDKEDLTFVSAAAAHSGARIEHNEAAGTVQIVGYGETKDINVPLATLKFTAKTSGKHNVTVAEAKVDNSGNAISEDTPAAAVPVPATEVKVAYPVTLPENFTGDPTVLPDGTCQFTAPNEYYDIIVTVGGEKVEPDVSGLVYTIEGINGDVVITAVGKTYHVTKTASYANITGEDTAQYDKDYAFTVTPEAGYMISNVSVKLGEADVEYTTDGNGNYVVSGKEIMGDLTITATAVSAANTTQITFTGVDSAEVVGGLTQSAENGKDFHFQLNKEEGYYYVVMLGETRLSADAEGIYTIAGAEIKGEPLTVAITKTLMGTMNVEVSQYLTLNDTVMWLVKATMDEQVMAYGAGNTMYWSDAYNAYCWLVISADSEELVKNAALETVCVAEEAAVAPKVSYDGDVNQSAEVDVNDAQLTYDMYQAKMYEDFTLVTMDKFLEADVTGNGTVNVEDAAAIVAQLIK